MRKLNCLLIAFAIFAVACENSFDEQSKNQITLSSKTIEVHFESNEHTINVTSPYSWIAESKNDWISLTCDNGIAGTEELRFVCDRNLEESERKGTIVIKNEDFGLATELYVTQKSFIPELVVEQDKTLSFTEKGGSEIIKVSSNFNYSVSDNASWISCDKVEEGVRVTASASDVVNERTAQVTIYSEKYNLSYDVGVSQGAFEPYLNIYTSELNFNSEHSTQYVSVSTNASFGVSSSSNWLYCTTENGKAKITAYKNTTTEQRTASVRVYLYNYNVETIIKLTQDAFVPVIEVNGSTNVSIDASAKSGTVKIVATSNFEYKISANVDWVSCSRKYNENEITITYTTNLDMKNSRSAEITLYSDIYMPKVVISLTQSYLPLSHVIFYTSSDNKIIEPRFSHYLSNTYEDGVGIIKFDGPFTYVNNSSFKGCKTLTSMILPQGVRYIDAYAFMGCSSLADINLPDSLTKIAIDAFSGCASLVNITIPDSVTSIEGYAFSGCSSLTSITIPDSVTEIGSYAFYYCTSLKSATIGNGVTSIGVWAFYDCTSLISVAIGNSVTSLGEKAFYNCKSMTMVYISDLSAWCKISFDYSYANPLHNGAKLFLNDSELTDITIPSDITEINNFAFYNCKSMTSVTIPDSVTSIGAWAFWGCTSLTNVYCKPITPPAVFYNYSYNPYDGSSIDGSFPLKSGMRIYVPRNSYDDYMQYSSYTNGIYQTNWYKYEQYIEPYDFE